MRFHAYHGCFDFERREGGVYSVSISYTLDITEASQTDDIKDAVDYPKVYDVVRREMETSSNLLEHLAPRIGRAVKAEFPQIEQITVRIEKLRPPMQADIRAAVITVTL